MQTFLPLPSFADSARCLDYRRLGKQRMEAMQLVNTLIDNGGWGHHPAARMWRHHVPALMAYHDECVREWVRRGYVNNMLLYRTRVYKMPPWFGDNAFHASHRAVLLFKNPQWYGQFGWEEEPALSYVWP